MTIRSQMRYKKTRKVVTGGSNALPRNSQKNSKIDVSNENRYKLHPPASHLEHYNEILIKLLKRRAVALRKNYDGLSHEQWNMNLDHIPSSYPVQTTIHDNAKNNSKFTPNQFFPNRNSNDITNYLLSNHTSTAKVNTDSKFTPISIQNRSPIVLMAMTKPKKKIQLAKNKTGDSPESKSTKTTSKKTQSTRTTTPKSKSTKTITTKGRSTEVSARSKQSTVQLLVPHDDQSSTFKKKPTYNLSNWDYIQMGWTKLPDHSITKRIYTLGAQPSFPRLWAFKERTDGTTHYYPNTKILSADFQGGLPYYVYHPNGEVAISITNGRIGPRMIVYSMSQRNASGYWINSRPQAVFDSRGNGVVYDIDGRMKMNYDQIEGALYLSPRRNRPVLHWYWKESTYVRMRREDLQGLPSDRNDDIDPLNPDGIRTKTASKITGSSRRKKKKGAKKGKKSDKAKNGKIKSGRKSRTGRKSQGGRKGKKTKSYKKTNRNEKTGTDDETVTSRHSLGSGKSMKSSKNKSAKKSPAKKNKQKRSVARTKSKSSKKRARSHLSSRKYSIPPLRPRPINPRPILDVGPIPVKITDHVSLRIQNQQHIHVDFDCGSVHYRFYVGVNILPEKVERIDNVVDPKRVPNITPCYVELMPLRSKSVYFINRKLQSMRREAAERNFKEFLKTPQGFYSWWRKKRRVKFQNVEDYNEEYGNVNLKTHTEMMGRPTAIAS